MYLEDLAGNILGSQASPLIVQQAVTLQSDVAFWVPPSAMLPTVVANIAYASPIALPSGPTRLQCLRATDSSSGATAIVQVPFSFKTRTTVGKGLTVTGLTVFWSLTVADLTVGPSCTINTVTFVGADAGGDAATLVNTAGGTITPSPATTQLDHNITAGRLYATTFGLGTPLALNNGSLAEAYAELSFPCSTGSVVYIAGCSVAATDQP
jgi:hypothetical protein